MASSSPSPFSIYLHKLHLVSVRSGFASYHNVIDSARIVEDVLVQAASTFCDNKPSTLLRHNSVSLSLVAVSDRLRDSELLTTSASQQINQIRESAQWIISSSSRQLSVDRSVEILNFVTSLTKEFNENFERARQHKPRKGDCGHDSCRDSRSVFLLPQPSSSSSSSSTRSSSGVRRSAGSGSGSGSVEYIRHSSGLRLIPLVRFGQSHLPLPYKWSLSHFMKMQRPLHNTAILHLDEVEEREMSVDIAASLSRLMVVSSIRSMRAQQQANEAAAAAAARRRARAKAKARKRRQRQEGKEKGRGGDERDDDDDNDDNDDDDENNDNDEDENYDEDEAKNNDQENGEDDDHDDDDDDGGDKKVTFDDSASKSIPKLPPALPPRLPFAFSCIVCHLPLLLAGDVSRVECNLVYTRPGRQIKTVTRNRTEEWKSRRADEYEEDEEKGAAAGGQPAREREETQENQGEELEDKDGEGGEKGGRRESSCSISCNGCGSYMGRYFLLRDQYRLIYIHRGTGQNYMYTTFECTVQRCPPKLHKRLTEDALNNNEDQNSGGMRRKNANSQNRIPEYDENEYDYDDDDAEDDDDSNNNNEDDEDEDEDGVSRSQKLAERQRLRAIKASLPPVPVIGLPHSYISRKQASFYPFPRFGAAEAYAPPLLSSSHSQSRPQTSANDGSGASTPGRPQSRAKLNSIATAAAVALVSTFSSSTSSTSSSTTSSSVSTPRLGLTLTPSRPHTAPTSTVVYFGRPSTAPVQATSFSPFSSSSQSPAQSASPSSSSSSSSSRDRFNKFQLPSLNTSEALKILQAKPDPCYALADASNAASAPSELANNNNSSNKTGSAYTNANSVIEADVSILVLTDKTFLHRRCMDVVTAHLVALFKDFPGTSEYAYTNCTPAPSHSAVQSSLLLPSSSTSSSSSSFSASSSSSGLFSHHSVVPIIPVFTDFFVSRPNFTLSRGTARYVFHYLTGRDDSKMKRMPYTFTRLVEGVFAKKEHVVVHLTIGGYSGHRLVIVKLGDCYRVYQSNECIDAVADRYTLLQWVSSDDKWSRTLSTSDMRNYLVRFEEARRGARAQWQDIFCQGKKAQTLFDRPQDDWKPKDCMFISAPLLPIRMEMQQQPPQ